MDTVARPGSRLRIGVLIALASIMAGGALGAAWPVAWRADLALWLGLFVAGELLRVRLPRDAATMSMAPAPYFAGLVCLPSGEVLLLSAVAVGSVELLFKPRPPERAVFNIAQTVLCLAGASWTLRAPGAGIPTGGGSWLLWCGSMLLAGAVFYLVNRLLVALAISLHDGRPLCTAWGANFGVHRDRLYALGLSSYGACVGLAVGSLGLPGMLALVPALALARPYLLGLLASAVARERASRATGVLRRVGDSSSAS